MKKDSLYIQIESIIHCHDLDLLTLRDLKCILRDRHGIDVVIQNKKIRRIVDDILSKM